MSELSITTTQNVTISFTAASVGERIFAYGVDLLIKIAYVIAFSYLVFDLFGFSTVMDGLDNWSKFAVLIVFYSPAIFYSIVQESLFEGQTLGKRLFRIKVVKIDGYQASFGDYLIRWVFRVIDINSNAGLVGLIALIMSDKTQRLGDMTAGTAVISLKSKININHTILEEVNQDYIPTYSLVIKLSDNDVRIIKDTFNVAVGNADYDTLRRLESKIVEVTGITNQSANVTDFIRTVLKDYSFYTQNM
jgi:uncharacterized RDD family membrane protein YckC